MKNVSASDSVPPISRLLELQQLIADFSKIQRVPLLADTMRPENDIEHSFGLALTCWYLAPKIAPELDMSKIFGYALSHDIVEIHAGDTFLYGDESLLATKSDREQAAIEQIKKDWPDFPELTDFTQGYKDKRDEEAKFVYAVDKLLPVFMVGLSERKIFYNRHKLTETKVRSKKEASIKTSKSVAPYHDLLMDWLVQTDTFYKP